MIWALAVLSVLAVVPAGLRWLRVAQREHYLFPSTTRFAIRWWLSGPVNRFLAALALAGVVGSHWIPPSGLLVPLAQWGPVGLSLRGESSPLAWTARLRRLASLAGALTILVLLAGIRLDSPSVIVAGVFGLPLIVDFSLLLLSPLESALGSKWVNKAARKLAAVRADVVAITGSYGKTTTKNYTSHLLAPTLRVVASPASFNNRMGLARAINENLAPGTQVFVAEMGTYGKGEIAGLTKWIPPRVAAMVAIGPVHLERFRTEERVVEAKSEILDRAEIGVICIDHPLLAALARERARDLEIIEVSTGKPARVVVDDGHVTVDGAIVAETPEGVFKANLAVAMGICLAFGVDPLEAAGRLDDLPMSEHRQTVQPGEGGFSIVDDTFNSNPAGARRALEVLMRAGAAGKKVVVTPGMVELGSRQDVENEAFAEAVGNLADHLVVVGATNRRSLLRGAEKGAVPVTVVASREEAVSWVRQNLGPGDAVLYENDLPDHYP